MKISRHHSSTTRNLNAALKALRSADALIRQAREALAAAGGGDVPSHLNAGTFEAMFALTCGRDGDGEQEPGGVSVIDLLEGALRSSAEQDDVNRAG